VSQNKVAPPPKKTTLIVDSSYPHLFTNFDRFNSIFSKMVLIVPQLPIIFTLSGFEYSHRK